jgi:hypothetical protein
VQQAIGDIDALGEQLSQEAREHLFTPKDELLVLDTPLLEIATGLVDLQNRIQLYISTISPESPSSGN